MSWVRFAQGLLIAAIALALPIGALCVFGFGADRAVAGNLVSIIFFGAFLGLLSSPWWPAAGQRGRPFFESLQGMVMIWFGVTFSIHVTWELGWLVLRDQIRVSRDAVWAYPWWAYIDGGDARYASANGELVAVECLSVAVGILGLTALWIRHRSAGRNSLATLMLMATAVAHVYGAACYLGGEAFNGFPNVDTTSIVDFVLKFWLLNGLWLVMPWAVLFWGKRTLYAQISALSR